MNETFTKSHTEVSTQGNRPEHTCHWPGCKRRVPPKMWGCSAHWFRLPATLRSKIWAAYIPGQEITKTPSAKYIEVAREVQAWIKSQGDLK